MKIVFICGSLEPGKDGVGDYTRRLCGELIRQGHDAAIIGLNDKHISGELILGQQEEQEVKINVMRLPVLLPWKQRINSTRLFIEKYNPDWLSLQYVPFGFDEKGLPFGLSSHLKILGKGLRWHIMFHESWIEIDSKTSLSKRVISIAQKIIIKRGLKKLKPSIINTSNEHYQKLLKDEGIESAVLPLSSNIPISKVDIPQMKNKFSKMGLGDEARSAWIVLGIFGSIRKNVNLYPLLYAKSCEAKQKNKKLAFLSIGRSGNYESKIFSDLKDKLGQSVLIHSFGECDAGEVSAFFQLIDFGVSTVPHSLVGKSGAYAAMRFHGIHVLIPEEDIQTKRLGDFDSISVLNRSSSDYDPQKIASDFIGYLSQN